MSQHDVCLMAAARWYRVINALFVDQLTAQASSHATSVLSESLSDSTTATCSKHLIICFILQVLFEQIIYSPTDKSNKLLASLCFT